MAGMQHYKMALDPAIIRLNRADMTNNRYKYFRWTPRTAWITFVYVGLVPALFGIVAYSTDGKYDLRAKRRGDDIREF
ncbi:putative nadh:ubiquinone oxidoreductase subunit protein [Phaeoacremonium minimum UCRPA7]|uniref:NADH dehydrogenase [ubiquinone] 1 beta subcomplex subunit 4 n=1 Tax=Phaeoacremonium minimum (strain UCR-PA7) TaxID=1286976 RepID=R8BFP2_PHAM7|nr:putative nadh:ubiquinone oxidoreductase subunit protein [Phaeoacremonium minimum UCRPA7]EON98118.1 putative nadh:ubiquinone oxidoreductase subunit protein [Phaeoacremonium minimum UCRPA7]